LLLAILAFLLGFGLLFTLALVGLLPYHAHVGSADYWIVASMYTLVVALASIIAYAAFWLYRPGARYLLLNSRGLTLEYADGHAIERKWSSPGFRLRISAAGTLDSSSAEVRLIQIAIQSVRLPHFELSEGALSAIVSCATAQNLEVRKWRVPLLGGKVWERLLITDPSR
jgi:hypothetical protein